VSQIVDRKNWTPRRGEARVETLPPSEVETQLHRLHRLHRHSASFETAKT